MSVRAKVTAAQKIASHWPDQHLFELWTSWDGERRCQIRGLEFFLAVAWFLAEGLPCCESQKFVAVVVVDAVVADAVVVAAAVVDGDVADAVGVVAVVVAAADAVDGDVAKAEDHLHLKFRMLRFYK